MTTPSSKDTQKQGSGTQLGGLGHAPPPGPNGWVPPGARVPRFDLPPGPASAPPARGQPPARSGRTDELLGGSRTIFEFTGEAASERDDEAASFGADELDLSEHRDRDSNLRSGLSPWLTLAIVVALAGVAAAFVVTRRPAEAAPAGVPGAAPATVPESPTGGASPTPITGTDSPAPAPSAPSPVSEAKPAAAAGPEAKPAPVPEAKPAPGPEPTPVPEAEPTPGPDAEPTPGPDAERAPETEPAPVPEAESEPAPEPKPAATKPAGSSKKPASKPAPKPSKPPKKQLSTDKAPRDFDALPPPPS